MIELRRTVAAAAALLVLGALTACGASTGGGGGGTPGLRSVSGSVDGYPYTGVSTVQAFAPQDGAQLLAGQLYPSPGARVDATLTGVPSIPTSSFVNPYFCSGATVTPATMRTTVVFLVGVADTGGTFGALARVTTSSLTGPASVGDRLYFVFAATRSGRISGACVLDGIAYDYDIDLSSGWTHVSGRVDAIDSFGAPVAVTYTDRAPGSNTTWAYADLADLSVAHDGDAVSSSFLDTMRGGFPEH